MCIRDRYKYGDEYLKRIIDDSAKEDRIPSEEIDLFLNKLKLTYTESDYNEFKIWCAKTGVMGIDPQLGVSVQKTFIRVPELKAFINGQLESLGGFRVPDQVFKFENKDTYQPDYIKEIQYAAVNKMFTQLEDRLRIFADDDGFIEEAKLRDVMFEVFPKINSRIMDNVLDVLQYNSGFGVFGQRKIMIDEYICMIKTKSGFEKYEVSDIFKARESSLKGATPRTGPSESHVPKEKTETTPHIIPKTGAPAIAGKPTKLMQYGTPNREEVDQSGFIQGPTLKVADMTRVNMDVILEKFIAVLEYLNKRRKIKI
eukprot:TRINITY_DN23782_c0_g2_i1.p1 TRINITY_DN23782_c0_g2~~TRINITY_DN23782_c0_g2_i1.p1  ORF type:complete len:313 (+),score=60.66 TRINITY_DN23782_c0_g2_i1:64-1002(+)